MRAGFTALVLALSAFYTYAAFAELTFLSSTGRLGPGFFPRVIGIGLIGACLAELAVERFRRSEPPRPSEYAGTVVLLAVFTAIFVLALNIIGGFLAMVAFMLATLMFLNRGRPVQNVALALVLPSAIYLLFDVWLNASIPRGMIVEGLLS